MMPIRAATMPNSARLFFSASSRRIGTAGTISLLNRASPGQTQLRHPSQLPAKRHLRISAGDFPKSTTTHATPLSCTTRSVQLPASPLLEEAADESRIYKDDHDGVPTIDATLLLDCRCDLGEGIVYDADHHQLLWTDINEKKFHALDLSILLNPSDNEANKLETQWTTTALPQMLGSFALRSSQKQQRHGTFLCAWEDGFQICRLLPRDFGDITPLGDTTAVTTSIDEWQLSERSMGDAVNPEGLPTRLNDGRCDPTGKRFICGGYYGEEKDVYMKVFRCETFCVTNETAYDREGKALPDDKDELPFLVHEPVFRKIQVTNSICFGNPHADNPNSVTMYLADSPQKAIYEIPYNLVTGTLDLDGQRTLHQTDRGVPDGSCIDQEGYIWNAVWRSGAGASFVQRVDPITGKVVFRVAIPVEHGTSQVACCCLGGPNLDILFMSTAAEHRDAAREPYAGGLYAAKVPFCGKPEVRFAH